MWIEKMAEFTVKENKTDICKMFVHQIPNPVLTNIFQSFSLFILFYSLLVIKGKVCQY